MYSACQAPTQKGTHKLAPKVQSLQFVHLFVLTEARSHHGDTRSPRATGRLGQRGGGGSWLGIELRRWCWGALTRGQRQWLSPPGASRMCNMIQVFLFYSCPAAQLTSRLRLRLRLKLSSGAHMQHRQKSMCSMCSAPTCMHPPQVRFQCPPPGPTMHRRLENPLSEGPSPFFEFGTCGRTAQ